jgi:inorganic pyrophosphatase
MSAGTTSAFAAVAPRNGDGTVNVVIDTPRGSRNKYKMDEALGCFKLSRILPAGLAFPFDFGSIPGTRAEDGDALDVLVLLDAPSFTGCLVPARLIGVLTARQTEKGETIRNDRLVAVPETASVEPRVRSLEELDPELLRQIEHFFASYNAFQGRRFEPLGRLGPEEAEALLAAAIENRRRAA